jgi:hypothetical protein
MPTLKMEGSMFLTAEMPDGVVLSFFFSGGAADTRRSSNERTISTNAYREKGGRESYRWWV